MEREKKETNKDKSKRIESLSSNSKVLTTSFHERITRDATIFINIDVKMGLGETEKHIKREKEKQTKTKAKNRKSKRQQQSLDHFLPCKNNS
jgi:hypothetical protein